MAFDKWNDGNTPGYTEVLSAIEIKNNPDDPVADSRHIRGGGLRLENLSDLETAPKGVLKANVTQAFVAETGRRYVPVAIPDDGPVVWEEFKVGGGDPATEQQVRRSVTDPDEANAETFTSPKGLGWFWDELKKTVGTFLGLRLGRDDAPGTIRTIAAHGSEANINLLVKPKGTGGFGVEGHQPNKVVSTDVDGYMRSQYELADEFVAVPPTLASPGVPGQKAWASPLLYYCIAPNTWVRFLAESDTFSFADLFVGVPPTQASPGVAGQWSYEPAAQLLWFCVGANTWVRFRAVPENYASMYVAVPPTPTSPGLQGQRAYDSAGNLMYECVAANTWVMYPVTSNW